MQTNFIVSRKGPFHHLNLNVRNLQRSLVHQPLLYYYLTEKITSWRYILHDNIVWWQPHRWNKKKAPPMIVCCYLTVLFWRRKNLTGKIWRFFSVIFANYICEILQYLHLWESAIFICVRICSILFVRIYIISYFQEHIPSRELEEDFQTAPVVPNVPH